MKPHKLSTILLTCSLVFLECAASYAKQPSHSVRTSILDNPYVVLAEDPKEKSLYGYVAALRTAPDRTDECKFFFKGEPFRNGISRLLIADTTIYRSPSATQSRGLAHGVIKNVDDKHVLEISDADRLGNCDWILGFIGEPSVSQKGKNFKISVNGEENGDWNSLAVICNKKAHFFSEPNEQKKRKAFVVAGDLIYVYEQTADWYYAKYSYGRSETVGWIKKVDTIQIQGGKIAPGCN
ncbi:MAG TPA: hypothetical protein VEC35_01695 [Noviherbaspirillum sp.]|nr:hypothetical protein [Noviherbaspirillum sp.]